MKHYLSIAMLFLSFTLAAQNPEVIVNLYSKVKDTKDTVYYCGIEKAGNGYLVIFPGKPDNVLNAQERRHPDYSKLFNNASDTLGPYEFYKKKNKIQFIDHSENENLQDIYPLINGSMTAPELFSHASDRYQFTTHMVNSHANVIVNGKNVDCYKYRQTGQFETGMVYRYIYINKKSMLPYRIEYFEDKNFSKLANIITAM